MEYSSVGSVTEVGVQLLQTLVKWLNVEGKFAEATEKRNWRLEYNLLSFPEPECVRTVEPKEEADEG